MNSWLATMWKHPYGFGEDECLNLPLVAGGLTRFLQRALGTTPCTLNIRRRDTDELPPKWRGDRFPANIFFAVRDALWEPKLRKAGFPERLYDYDIVVLDGGIPLLRSGKWILEFVNKGGKLSTTYYGSDLRQHGVLPRIDSAAGAVFVMEFDHTLIHPRAVWLPFPFNMTGLPNANPTEDGIIRIGHAANSRSAKGSERILEAIAQVAQKYPVEAVMIERIPHEKALQIKAECHIFIDQLGELGYGISGLEALAMGIPTVVELLPDHEAFIGNHPFVVANSENLPEVLESLIKDKEMRRELSKKGPQWVKEFHNPKRAVAKILEKYNELGWLKRGL